MQIETATRLVQLLEAKLESTERAIESLLRLSAKFEDVMCIGSATLMVNWTFERKALKRDIGHLEQIIQTTVIPITKKGRHLTVIK